MEQREASDTARYSPASPNSAVGKRITKRKQMQQIKRGAYQIQQISPSLGPATFVQWRELSAIVGHQQSKSHPTDEDYFIQQWAELRGGLLQKGKVGIRY